MFMTIYHKSMNFLTPRPKLLTFSTGLAIILVMGTTTGMFDYGYQSVQAKSHHHSSDDDTSDLPELKEGKHYGTCEEKSVGLACDIEHD
jgi:hypothetical protein